MLTVLILLFCGLWILIYLYLIWTLKVLPQFHILSAGLPAALHRGPKLSVIVPARDEAEHIESALQSLLRQDYENLEIIVVDDRSTDGTGAILQRMAQSDARIRTVRIDKLPDGWLGKVYALHRGTQAASGDWMLFTDADVHFAQGVIRRVLVFACLGHYDHVTLMPRTELSSFRLEIAVRAFGMLFFLNTHTGFVNRPGSKRFVGIGAFNLVRTRIFQRTAGFEWLRLEPGDDMGVGLLMKQAGARGFFAVAYKELSVPWYGSVRAMFKGLEKNLFGPGSHYQWWRMLLQVAGIWWLVVVPWLALWQGVLMRSSFLSAAALCTLALHVVFSFAYTRGRKLETAARLLFPLGMVLMSLMLLWGGIKCLRTGGIDWRGTHYPLAQLKAGQRLKF